MGACVSLLWIESRPRCQRGLRHTVKLIIRGQEVTCPYKTGYLLSVFFKHRLRGGEACDRHAVGGARNVIETQIVTEFHR